MPQNEPRHTPELQRAYDAGVDAGKNGPNTTNCHFSLFSSREMTQAWEEGKNSVKSRGESPDATK
jgi:hypothetical protein